MIKEGATSDLLFSDKLQLYSPEFIFEEFEKYKDFLNNKTGRTISDFNKLLELFKRRITIIPKAEIEPFVEKAKTISPDINDVAYVALALKLECAIWSQDKPLKEKQNIVKVYNTHEIMN